MSSGGAVKLKPKRRNGGRQVDPRIVERAEQHISVQHSHSDTARRLAAEFGISSRQAYRYIAAVHARMAADSEATRPSRKHALRASLQAVLRMAMQKEQLGAAVAALDRLCRLDGLFDPVKVGVHVTGSVEAQVRILLPEQRRARLEELLQLYDGTRPAPAMLPPDPDLIDGGAAN